MKHSRILLAACLPAILLLSCHDIPGGPDQPSLIVAHVHFGDEGVPGVRIVLVQFADTAYTNANGTIVFPVPPGKYTVRAFGINRGGPILLNGIDYDVTAPAGAAAFVDIVDCLPCL